MNHSIQFLLSFFLFCISATACFSQTEFSKTFETCDGNIHSIQSFDGETRAVIMYEWCSPDNTLQRTHISLVVGVEEMTTLAISGGIPIASYMRFNELNVVIIQNDEYTIRTYDSDLNAMNTVELDIPSPSWIFNVLPLDDELFVTSSFSGFTYLSRFEYSGELIEDFQMAGLSAPVERYRTFSRLLNNGNVLLSIDCPRTAYIDLNDVQASEWLDIGEFDNCFGYSVMEFSPIGYGTTNILYSIGGEENDAITMIFNDETGFLTSFFQIEADTDLSHADAIITENDGVYISGLRRFPLNGITQWDFVFFHTDMEGNVLYEFNWTSPEYSEYALHIYENDTEFWFYSARELHGSDQLEPYALVIPKNQLLLSVEENKLTSFIDIRLLPNEISIQSLANESITSSLYDLSGRSVVNKEAVNGSINTSNLPSGIYVLKCQSKSEIKTQKIFIN